MSQIGVELLPGSPLAVLSGPSFAAEVARGLPTAVTVAAATRQVAGLFAAALGSPRFRPYLSPDPIGAEIGGAVKNVLAIACGIVDGRGLGDNARAALITRGLAEMVRLGARHGRASGDLSRAFGAWRPGADLQLRAIAQLCSGPGAWARGRARRGRRRRARSVIEGVATAAAVAALAARLGIEMPISAAVDAVLHRGVPIGATIERLLRRPYRSE